MHRAYVPPSFIDAFLANPKTPLPADVEKRFFKILRIGPKEVVSVFDGQGRSITGEVTKDVLGLIIQGVVETAPSLRPQKLILLQAAIEEKKLSETLRHGTELGIDSFALFAAIRSEPFVFSSLQKRIERLQGVVIDASRQCGRVHCPSITFYENFPSFFGSLSPDSFMGVVGSVDAKKMLGATLSEIPKSERDIIVAIGPEGGLTKAEENELSNKSFHKVSLGPFTLRTEFAGLAAFAIVNQWI